MILAIASFLFASDSLLYLLIDVVIDVCGPGFAYFSSSPCSGGSGESADVRVLLFRAAWLAYFVRSLSSISRSWMRPCVFGFAFALFLSVLSVLSVMMMPLPTGVSASSIYCARSSLSCLEAGSRNNFVGDALLRYSVHCLDLES